MASPELIKENGVGILYLNSPSKRNSLTVQDMLLIRLLLEDQDHSDIAALIITGKGKVFCAGADFGEIVSITRKNSKGNKSLSNDMSDLCDTIQNFPLPTICAFNGNAYGGGVELACACDFRISKLDLEIMVPPAKLGIHYHLNGIKRFLSIFGLKKTRELLLLARKMCGDELIKIGFLDRIVEEGGNVLETAKSFAKQFFDLAPTAVSGMKLTINEIEMLSEKNGIVAERIKRCLESDDFQEGLKSVLEKRRPKFRT